jgi:hypothetical protein
VGSSARGGWRVPPPEGVTSQRFRLLRYHRRVQGLSSGEQEYTAMHTHLLHDDNDTGMTGQFHASYGAGARTSTPSPDQQCRTCAPHAPHRSHGSDDLQELRLTGTGAMPPHHLCSTQSCRPGYATTERPAPQAGPPGATRGPAPGAAFLGGSHPPDRRHRARCLAPPRPRCASGP